MYSIRLNFMTNRPIMGTLFLALIGLLPALFLDAQELRRPAAVDLLSWTSVESVELSPDGRQVIYETKRRDWQLKRFVRALWVAPTDGSGRPVRLTAEDGEQIARGAADNDESPRWAPDSSRIAFLSRRSGSPQIWIVPKPGGIPEVVTSSAGDVMAFEWAPDSRHIAFIALGAAEGFPNTPQDNDSGVVINKWNFSIYELLSNALNRRVPRTTKLCVIDVDSRTTEALMTYDSIDQCAWSPDGHRLAVLVHDSPRRWVGAESDDVIIYTLGDKTSEVIARGTGGTYFDPPAGYSNPVWSPGGDRLALSFKSQARRWQSTKELFIYHFDESRFRPAPWKERLVAWNTLAWPFPDRMLLQNTSRGSERLFWLSVSDGALTPIGSGWGGSNGRASVSQNGQTIAYVHGSTIDAPEVYVAHMPFISTWRLTSLNATLAHSLLPIFERTSWKSTDGVEVEGWLAKPRPFRANRKYPLLVFVHGGPGIVVPDDFEMYQEWPYPYRLAVLRGYLVFFPNYRGTGSYSATFADPHDIAREPVDDIVTGIQGLIHQGIVDATQIGIAGHSHGAWLGPQVLTTHPELFRAASFAEGATDLIANYALMSGRLNVHVHEYYYHGSPFNALERYVAMSPVFHVAGLHTPTLVEAGEQSVAVQQLQFETALWRCGVPSEFVLYPRTGHTIDRPAQEVESMERNLDWFDYWMLGKKDPSPNKAEQYKRWQQRAQERDEMRRLHSCSAEESSAR